MSIYPELPKDMPDDAYGNLSAANYLHWKEEHDRENTEGNAENPSETTDATEVAIKEDTPTEPPAA